MANYYYNKYNTTTTYSQGPSTHYSNYNNPSYGGYPGYNFNSATNKYSMVGTYDPNSYNTGYSLITGGMRVSTPTSPNTWTLDDYLEANSIVSYSKGSLVQSNIIAADGTYPVNGRHTDGYWYVRGALVFPAISVNIGGVQKAGVSGAVNIDAVWKPFNDMWVNVGGIWKKS